MLENRDQILRSPVKSAAPNEDSVDYKIELHDGAVRRYRGIKNNVLVVTLAPSACLWRNTPQPPRKPNHKVSLPGAG